MSDFFPELSSQGKHHQQECPYDFDDTVSTKDDSCYTSVKNEPNNESLLRTQPLIDDHETSTIKYLTLDHGANKLSIMTPIIMTITMMMMMKPYQMSLRHRCSTNVQRTE